MALRLGEFSPASWAIVYFGQFFDNDINCSNISATLYHVNSHELIVIKWVGLPFGRFFHGLIGSPWWQGSKIPPREFFGVSHGATRRNGAPDLLRNKKVLSLGQGGQMRLRKE
jgi:hypothetical protein